MGFKMSGRYEKTNAAIPEHIKKREKLDFLFALFVHAKNGFQVHLVINLVRKRTVLFFNDLKWIEMCYHPL